MAEKAEIVEEVVETVNDQETVVIEEEKAEAVSESPKYIEKVEEKLKNQKYNIDDIEYMKTELMSLIATNQTVLAGLADQLKIGCPPHMYDVFRNLTET